MTEGDSSVMVTVSIELLAQLKDDWSSPVQIQIEPMNGGTGYVMNARTHTCEQDVIEVGTRLGFELGKAEGRKQAGEEIAKTLYAHEDTARRAEESAGIAGDKGAAQAWFNIATGYMRSAKIAQGITAQPSDAPPEPLTASTGHSDLPEAVRQSEEPCELPDCLDHPSPRIPGGEG